MRLSSPGDQRGRWTRPKLTPQCHPEKKHYAKGLCKTCYTNRRPGWRRAQRRWLKSPKGRAHLRRYRLRRSYRLTESAYQALYDAQHGRCAICNMPLTNPVVDHDHTADRVRGLLCSECNLGLGKFKDDPTRLRAAAVYLVGKAIE